MNMEREILIPFNNVENICIPNPRSVIQIAVSDTRSSHLSDKEMAEHICASLFHIMRTNVYIIAPEQQSKEYLKFDKPNNQ